MEVSSQISRKTLHLKRERRMPVKSAQPLTESPTGAISKLPVTDVPRHIVADNDRAIEIRYRCGKAISPTIVAAAVDMRKQCFLSTASYLAD